MREAELYDIILFPLPYHTNAHILYTHSVCPATKEQVQSQSCDHQKENRKSYRKRLFGKVTRGQVSRITIMYLIYWYSLQDFKRGGGGGGGLPVLSQSH